MQKKQNSVDKYIAKIQVGLMKEFERLDLPLRLRLHIKNLAREEGLAPVRILQREIDRYRSLDSLIEAMKTPMKIKRQERRARRDATRAESPYGIFGEKIIGNHPPVQGGAPGLGKSARQLRGFKE